MSDLYCLNCDRALPADADPEYAVCLSCYRSDSYEHNTERMAESLRGMGWTAEAVGLSGGFVGVILSTDDDESDVLVSAPGFADEGSDPWAVQPACQSHPAYGIDVALIPWEADGAWLPMAQRISTAAILVAKYGPHACPDCPTVPVRP